MKNIFYILYTIILLSTLVSCTNESEKDTKKNEVVVVDTIPKVLPNLKYNLDLNTYLVDTGSVKANEGLTHILPQYGVSLATIYAVAEEFDSIFDVKKIKPKHHYTVLSEMEDTIKKAKYFIYEINAIDYLVYHFEDSLNLAYIEQKDVDTVRNYAGGVIESSLWNAFVDQNLSPALIKEFAKLYAWSIDFFDVKKGDYFKVIYDAKYVEDEFVGIGTIHAVLFNHRQKDFYFFRYETDSLGYGYYTETGEQMKKALLSAPLVYTRVSSKFSKSRLHPVLKIYRPHYGVDYAAPKGTEVVATGSGKVIYAGYSGGAGNLVKIKHDIGNIETKYLHLSKFGPGIKKGVHVLQGQKIGEVGSTGISTGPHLDYRVYIDGKPVDPLGIDIPAADPLSDSTLVAFKNLITPVKYSLDSIAAISAEPEISEDATSDTIQ